MVKILLILLLLFLTCNMNLDAQWEKANGGKELPDSTAINAVVAFADTIVVATSKGIYFSANNGDDWSQKNNGLDNPSGIIILSHNNGRVFAGTDNGLYVSPDNCNSWSSGSVDMSSDMVYSFAVKGNNIFAGTSNGFYLSSDNGNSWTLKNNGLNQDDPTINALSIQGSNIFAATTDGVYATTNNGDSWSNKNFTNEITRIYVSNTAIFISGEGYHSGIYVSIDNGYTWIDKNNGLDNSKDMHYTFISVGDSVFAGGTRTGIYLTTNNGDTWVPANDGLSSYSQSFELSFAYNDKYIFTGSKGDGGFCTLWRLPRNVTKASDDESNNESITLYPNPTVSLLNVSFDLPVDGYVSLCVFDELGNVILSVPGELKNKGENNFVINTESFLEGIFFMKINEPGKTILKKFIVIK